MPLDFAADRPANCSIVEVSPRDGLQNESLILPTQTKIELIRKMARAGARRIEAVSFVNPKRVPQMADAEAVLEGIRDLRDVRISGLVLNERGFSRAAASGLREINYVVVASETFSQRNQGASIAEMQSLWRQISALAKSLGIFRSVTIAAAFGCPFEGLVPIETVLNIAAEIVEIGVEELALADTIGVATPVDVEERFGLLRQRCAGPELRAHFHNTRNTGYANADAALRANVTTLDASLGGLGGCPFAPGAAGNIATEDLAYLLNRQNIAHDIDFDLSCEASRWLAEAFGRALPGNLARVTVFPPTPQPGRR